MISGPDAPLNPLITAQAARTLTGAVCFANGQVPAGLVEVIAGPEPNKATKHEFLVSRAS